MSPQRVIKSNEAPPGVYQHVHSGVRIQVDWQPYKEPRKNAHTEIGELVQIGVTVVGAIVIVVTFVVGITNVVMYLGGVK